MINKQLDETTHLVDSARTVLRVFTDGRSHTVNDVYRALGDRVFDLPFGGSSLTEFVNALRADGYLACTEGGLVLTERGRRDFVPATIENL